MNGEFYGYLHERNYDDTMNMKHFSHKDVTYQVDEQGFLLEPKFWDINFAEGMAKECEIQNLTTEHWDVINFIREAYAKTGACPTIFAVCTANGLRPREMKKLFPTGYHRGLCRITPLRYAAIALIFLSNLIMAGSDLFSMSHLRGILLLLAAAGVYMMHMTGIRQWRFDWRDVLVTVPVVNVILFIPLWFLFPSALFKAPMGEIVLQSVYQGIVVNIAALMCVAYTIRKLGLITASLYMSFVPVVTALFAWIFLGEHLILREILGIAGCSAGLLLYTRGQTSLHPAPFPENQDT